MLLKLVDTVEFQLFIKFVFDEILLKFVLVKLVFDEILLKLVDTVEFKLFVK